MVCAHLHFRISCSAPLGALFYGYLSAQERINLHAIALAHLSPSPTAELVTWPDGHGSYSRARTRVRLHWT